MSPMAWTLVVLVVVVVLAAALAAPLVRRRRLRQRFGPEYDRLVQSTGNRRQAEQELAQRQKRVESFDLEPLDPEQRKRYAGDWMQVQELFVDDPVKAVAEAKELLTSVMRDRGYPSEGEDRRVADLSVKHAGVIEHYRVAQELSGRAAAGEASTEDLRQAMVRYRALFADLLEEPGKVRH